MGKREQKIEVIKKYIKSASGNWDGYEYGNIPSNLISNACSSYAGAVNKKDILGLIDITVLSNGKKGMLFTEHNVYYSNGILGKTGSISYKKISETGTIPGEVLDSTYNYGALKDLLSSLAYIETSNIADDVDNALNYMNQGVQRASDIVDKGIELLDSGLELFSTLASIFGTDDNGNNDKK